MYEVRFDMIDGYWWIYRDNMLDSIIPFTSAEQAIDWIKNFDAKEAERLYLLHSPF